MRIAILLYPDFTALDAVGPYEALSRPDGWRVRFVAAESRPHTTETGMLTLLPEATLDEVPRPDVLLVPGGIGARDQLDGPIVDWIRDAHPHTSATTSVCTGAFLLGAAGVLRGLEATTYWSVLPMLEHFGATPVRRRWVEQGKVVTAAGVSAGIDMALALVARLADERTARAIQLGIEYDPAPPFDSGDASSASEDLKAAALERIL